MHPPLPSQSSQAIPLRFLNVEPPSPLEHYIDCRGYEAPGTELGDVGVSGR